MTEEPMEMRLKKAEEGMRRCNECIANGWRALRVFLIAFLIFALIPAVFYLESGLEFHRAVLSNVVEKEMPTEPPVSIFAYSVERAEDGTVEAVQRPYVMVIASGGILFISVAFCCLLLLFSVLSSLRLAFLHLRLRSLCMRWAELGAKMMVTKIQKAGDPAGMVAASSPGGGIQEVITNRGDSNRECHEAVQPAPRGLGSQVMEDIEGMTDDLRQEREAEEKKPLPQPAPPPPPAPPPKPRG